MSRNEEFQSGADNTRYRQAIPAGHSPEEEWHGPYEVVQHPEKKTFHVVDNQGRAASTWDADWQGRSSADNAEAGRDHIDRTRASKEKAKGFADSLYNGMAKAMGYEDGDHMDMVNRNRRDESFMLEHPGATYDQNREKMVLKIPGKNGWYGVHTGAYTEMHHETGARNVPVDAIPYYEGWPSAEKAHKDVHDWIDDVGEDYEKNVLPYHRDKH